jgi:hypothetical protein
MDLVGSGRGLILRYYLGIRLEELKKKLKPSIRIAGRQGRESNPGNPEYDVGVLTNRPRRSVEGKKEERKSLQRCSNEILQGEKMYIL